MQRRITEAHLLLVITFGLYIGYQWCQQWLPFDNLVVHVVIGQLILVLPGVCWMRYRGADFKSRFRFYPLSRKNLGMTLCVLLSAYPVVVMLNILSMLFVKNAMTTVISSMESLGIIPMIFIMAVMPAFNEEFLCRGVLYQTYRPVSIWKGAVLSAFIFGLLHLNFNQMPYAFFIGIVFALMVEATGSICTSMLMHFLLNGFNVSLNYISNYINPISAEEAQAMSQQFIHEMTATPEILKNTVFLAMVIIIAFLILTGLVIKKTFRINGRSLKGECIQETEEGGSSIFDIWVLIFIAFALLLSYLNTKFL